MIRDSERAWEVNKPATKLTEFDSQGPYGARNEPSPQNCPLFSHMHPYTQTHKHTQNM